MRIKRDDGKIYAFGSPGIINTLGPDTETWVDPQIVMPDGEIIQIGAELKGRTLYLIWKSLKDYYPRRVFEVIP